MAKKTDQAKNSQDGNVLKPGYIRDYISGKPVKATPEETEAVQVFARRLVEDYGYSKSQIQTRPQFRVRKRPSDESKSYPVDIAIFKGRKKIEDQLYIVVECKKKNRRDGIAQLKLYLDMSPTELGVWFNGEEHVYLRKIHHKDGSRTYEDLPNIPRKGQRIEDIGLFKRKDLKKPSNLKAVFKDIRNHLAGMTTGITRDEALAQEIINILFCKILDEQETEPNETVTFRAGFGEKPEVVQERILDIFERVKTHVYDDVFSEQDTIRLDARSLRYVVGELQNYCVMDADRDAIGDAFEVFIGPALRGAEGQFFTPRNVVKMVVKILDPRPGEKIIDPACGSGGFLIAALEHVWGHLKEEGKKKKWKPRQLVRREIEVATNCFRGIDKDAFLAKVCKAYMALVGDGRGGIFCDNALIAEGDWSTVMQDKIRLGSFDVVMTNPPFGSRIPVKGRELLSQYKLAFKWSRTNDAPWSPSAELKDSEAPQILFIERCVHLLKHGGRLGIVLPEGIFGNRGMGYILDFLRTKGRILGIVDCTRCLFQPSTDTKTDVLFFEKCDPSSTAGMEQDSMFFAVAKTCGHDKRGKPIYRKGGEPEDEISEVSQALKGQAAFPRRLAFTKRVDDLNPYYLVPRYYSPEVEECLADFANQTNASLISVENLVSQGRISIGRGHEIGSDAYGTGTIPFIRTSDIANYEITYDPTYAIDTDTYEHFAPKQNLLPLDILFVNDGRYRIGNVCILTEHDTKIVIQSHFRIIRSLDTQDIDPFLLLYLFRHPVVRLQVESKIFIQSTIATIGKRLGELILPIPKKSTPIWATIIKMRDSILARAALRADIQNIEQHYELKL